MRLRIATYNIHRCVGNDGMESCERIAGVLKQINADVTALQEVAFSSNGPVDVLMDLARSVGGEAIPGPTLLEEKGHYGNAVVTRMAPATVERLDISVPGREPRGVLKVAFGAKGRSLRIVATHLGLRPGERRYQMRRLLTMLDDHKDGVTIVLGDFNEWFNWARPLRWLTRRLGGSPSPATFPSRRPLLPLDRIWVHPAEKLINLYSHRSATAAVASDHLPLVAEIRI
jgi:endonuclease/exonuclease/phosphatase family metal-dependent hydrolase